MSATNQSESRTELKRQLDTNTSKDKGHGKKDTVGRRESHFKVCVLNVQGLIGNTRHARTGKRTDYVEHEHLFNSGLLPDDYEKNQIMDRIFCYKKINEHGRIL